MTACGAIPPDASLIMDVLSAEASAGGGTGSGTSALPSCVVRLLLPLSCDPCCCSNSADAATTAGAAADVVVEVSLCGGYCNLTGSVHGLVYAAKREPFGRALAELKVGGRGAIWSNR